MSDALNSPEMLDWIECHEQAVTVVASFLDGFSKKVLSPTTLERSARALLACLASADITVAWNREESDAGDGEDA